MPPRSNPARSPLAIFEELAKNEFEAIAARYESCWLIGSGRNPNELDNYPYRRSTTIASCAPFLSSNGRPNCAQNYFGVATIAIIVSSGSSPATLSATMSMRLWARKNQANVGSGGLSNATAIG